MPPLKGIVNGCNSVREKKRDDNLANHTYFYAMPSDEERMEMWLTVIKNYNGLRPFRKQFNLKKAIVCAKHFSDDSFYPNVLSGAKKLLPHAVPSIFFGSIEVVPKEPPIPSDEVDLSHQPPQKKQRINYVVTNQLVTCTTYQG